MSDDIAFGDTEPEDAWHPEDPILVLADNLIRRLDILDGHDQPEGRYRELLQLIEQRLRPWLDRRGTLSDREETRVAQLAEDLEFLRERDDRGGF